MTIGRVVCRTAALLGVALTSLPLGVLARLGWRDRALRWFGRLVTGALGVTVRTSGPTPPRGCLVVANHVGYLDIVVLGGAVPGSFLAKSEIAGWTYLGSLTRWGRAVFVERERMRQSRSVIETVVQRLGEGDRVILFAEAGVSPDGVTLAPFRPMLFEACVSAGRPAVPVALRYTRPADPGVWAWVEEPSLWRHLWRRVLPASGIEVEVRFGAAVMPRPGEGRKQLAAKTRVAVARLMERDA